MNYMMPTVYMNVTASSGTDMTMFIDFGDNGTIQKAWFADFTLLSPINITYAEENVYNATISLSNTGSYKIVSKPVCYVQEVKGTMTVSQLLSSFPFVCIYLSYFISLSLSCLRISTIRSLDPESVPYVY